jgi:ferric-dicitrate binding protein FerR (iron transport regulator)
MKDYRDIWNEAQGRGLSEEQLLAWLEGRLPEAERHALEEMLASDSMESDALEGLQSLGESDAKQMRRQANTRLWKSLAKRRRPVRRRSLQHSGLVALAAVLILILACFLVFWMLRR